MTAVVINEDMEKSALSLVERGKLIAVKSTADRTLAVEIGKAIVQLDKDAEEWFEPLKRTAAAAHKAVCNKENEVRNPLKEAKQYLARQIGEFDAALERARLLEEARLQEEANRLAREESQRLAQEQAISDAIELEAIGDAVGAAAVLANPVPVEIYAQPVILPKQVMATKGVSTVQKWSYRITDANKVPREYLMIDESAVKKVVSALKSKCNIPGIEAYPEHDARFRLG